MHFRKELKRTHRWTVMRNSLLGLLIVFPVASIGIEALRETDGKNSLASSRSDEPISEDASEPNEPAQSPTQSPRPECDQIDSCNENEGLDHAQEWLASRLQSAGLDYLNDFRADGGGGHYLPERKTLVQVLRPIRPSDEAQGSFQGYGEPLWDHNGTDVFGQSKNHSPVAYFYWRVGGVDTFAGVTWQGSGASTMQDFKQVFDKLIDSQRAQPYFEMYKR